MIRTEHRDERFKFPFVKYSPTNGKNGLPLVIQLHGAGERGDGKEDLCKVDDGGFTAFIKDKEYDCIFIMPQCPKGSFWAAKVESIIDFIESVAKEYTVDRDRIYLTGLSMGGFGTWYTAMAKPSLFAAIAPVCGGGMAWAAGMLNMPVWAFHGVDDPTVSVMHSDEMVAKLKELGREVKYSRLEGVGHNAWSYTFDGELLEWFLEHSKN